MICVTGAGGTVGSEVVRQLEAAKVPFRAAYFSKDKVEAARKKGLDAVSIDFNHPETLRAAFKGCDKLFLLSSSAPNQTELELNAVEAAKAAGMRSIVKLSVWGADEGAFDFAKVHRPVEKAIEASGLSWTFLRPNSFMQNVVTYMAPTIRSDGAFYSAADEARISHVDVRDIAAVAVKALTSSGHEKKAYTLSGPEALTYDALASVLTKVLGRPIRHVKLSPRELKEGLLSSGIPPELAEKLLDLERFYREQRASGVTNDIRQVTGRDPIRFEQFARDRAAEI
jgi:uncharacterized protein YbjT (DUF2867 family)